MTQGEAGGDDLQEVRYEGYGPGGTVVMMECLSADSSRTAAEIRDIFDRYGGYLGAAGAVAYLFHPTGVLRYPPGSPGDRIRKLAFEAGAEDVVTREDGFIEVLTDPATCETLRADLTASGLPPRDSEVTQRAATSVALDREQAESMAKLLQALESLDGVHNVYTNANIPHEILARV